MASTSLSASEARKAKVWLKTIFFPAVKNGDIIDGYIKYIKEPTKKDDIIAACKAIYANILKLTFDPNDNIFKPALETLVGATVSY